MPLITDALDKPRRQTRLSSINIDAVLILLFKVNSLILNELKKELPEVSPGQK